MSARSDLDKHHRRSMRLQGFDYTREGTYFVTVCTKDRACLFGDISDGKMILNDAGLMAQKYWHDIPHIFPTLNWMNSLSCRTISTEFYRSLPP